VRVPEWASVRRARWIWIVAVLSEDWGYAFRLLQSSTCGALLLAQVDMIEFIFLHFVSILNNFKTLVRQQPKRACYKTDGIINIVAVAAENFHARGRVHLKFITANAK